MFRLSVLLRESGAGGGTVGLTGIGSSNSAETTRPTPAVLQAFLRLLAATLPKIRRLPCRAAAENDQCSGNMRTVGSPWASSSGR